MRRHASDDVRGHGGLEGRLGFGAGHLQPLRPRRLERHRELARSVVGGVKRKVRGKNRQRVAARETQSAVAAPVAVGVEDLDSNLDGAGENSRREPTERDTCGVAARDDGFTGSGKAVRGVGGGK